MRRLAFQVHGTILTLVHFMSVSLMCHHVVSQMTCVAESFLTNMTLFVSDVQMDRVLVSCQMRVRLRTERAYRVVARKRLFVTVLVSLVFGDTSPPCGSKSASRMIAGKRSGCSVNHFQMSRQTGLPRGRKLTIRLRTLEDVIAMGRLLVPQHAFSSRKSIVTDIAGKKFPAFVPGPVIHAE